MPLRNVRPRLTRDRAAQLRSAQAEAAQLEQMLTALRVQVVEGKRDLEQVQRRRSQLEVGSNLDGDSQYRRRPSAALPLSTACRQKGIWYSADWTGQVGARFWQRERVATHSRGCFQAFL